MTTDLLTVTVGSHAHGLAGPDSDLDLRSVFVAPTKELLAVNGNAPRSRWHEGDVDDTAWELGHFLNLAIHSNPTILEVFLAPVRFSTPFGDQLRELFPYVWSSRGVRDAFVGYAHNQRKKFLDNKDDRRNKWAAHYLRVLCNGWELLTTGTFTVRIVDTPMGEVVAKLKRGEFTLGEVIDLCATWEDRVNSAYVRNPDHYPDLERINTLLLQVRWFNFR